MKSKIQKSRKFFPSKIINIIGFQRSGKSYYIYHYLLPEIIFNFLKVSDSDIFMFLYTKKFLDFIELLPVFYPYLSVTIESIELKSKDLLGHAIRMLDSQEIFKKSNIIFLKINGFDLFTYFIRYYLELKRNFSKINSFLVVNSEYHCVMAMFLATTKLIIKKIEYLEKIKIEKREKTDMSIFKKFYNFLKQLKNKIPYRNEFKKFINSLDLELEKLCITYNLISTIDYSNLIKNYKNKNVKIEFPIFCLGITNSNETSTLKNLQVSPMAFLLDSISSLFIIWRNISDYLKANNKVLIIVFEDLERAIENLQREDEKVGLNILKWYLLLIKSVISNTNNIIALFELPSEYEEDLSPLKNNYFRKIEDTAIFKSRTDILYLYHVLGIIKRYLIILQMYIFYLYYLIKKMENKELINKIINIIEQDIEKILQYGAQYQETYKDKDNKLFIRSFLELKINKIPEEYELLRYLFSNISSESIKNKTVFELSTILDPIRINIPSTIKLGGADVKIICYENFLNLSCTSIFHELEKIAKNIKVKYNDMFCSLIYNLNNKINVIKPFFTIEDFILIGNKIDDLIKDLIKYKDIFSLWLFISTDFYTLELFLDYIFANLRSLEELVNTLLKEKLYYFPELYFLIIYKILAFYAKIHVDKFSYYHFFNDLINLTKLVSKNNLKIEYGSSYSFMYEFFKLENIFIRKEPLYILFGVRFLIESEEKDLNSIERIICYKAIFPEFLMYIFKLVFYCLQYLDIENVNINLFKNKSQILDIIVTYPNLPPLFKEWIEEAKTNSDLQNKIKDEQLISLLIFIGLIEFLNKIKITTIYEYQIGNSEETIREIPADLMKIYKELLNIKDINELNLIIRNLKEKSIGSFSRLLYYILTKLFDLIKNC